MSPPEAVKGLSMEDVVETTTGSAPLMNATEHAADVSATMPSSSLKIFLCRCEYL